MIGILSITEGGPIMDWEVPSFVEIKMDAEIGSYQDDFRDDPDAKEPSAETPITITHQT
jgi:hypothetical protein